MNTAFPFKAWIILLTMHTFCQAEYHFQRVILVPPEKLGFSFPARVGYEANPYYTPDPFAESSSIYLSPKRPVREIVQDLIGIKIPNDSTIFYDAESRALSVSSTQSVIDAISSAMRSPGRPNVTVEVITHETPPHQPAGGAADGPRDKPPIVISRDRFQVFSAGTGSLKIKAPESIAKSTQLEFRIVPTVNEEIDFVFAEISLAEDTNSAAQKAPPAPQGHLKTTITLKFNTTTTVYEKRLPSGGDFGISVRLTYQYDSPDPARPPAEPPPAVTKPSPH